jgi:hypothetical protein
LRWGGDPTEIVHHSGTEITARPSRGDQKGFTTEAQRSQKRKQEEMDWSFPVISAVPHPSSSGLTISLTTQHFQSKTYRDVLRIAPQEEQPYRG